MLPRSLAWQCCFSSQASMVVATSVTLKAVIKYVPCMSHIYYCRRIRKYRISCPIRCTVIFSLEILETKIMMNVF